jgi:hypothetical protein
MQMACGIDCLLFHMCHADSCGNNTFFRCNYLVTNSYADIICVWGEFSEFISAPQLQYSYTLIVTP